MQVLSWFALVATSCQAIFYLVATILIVYIGINVLAMMDRINREMDRREVRREYPEPTHTHSDKGV